jgi:hypothetical protein
MKYKAAFVVLLAFVLAITSLTLTMGSAIAQTKSHARRNGVVAGVAAYAAAKHTGKNRLKHGQKRNFMQRHPVLTGIAAYGIAHHYSKKHHKH